MCFYTFFLCWWGQISVCLFVVFGESNRDLHTQAHIKSMCHEQRSIFCNTCESDDIVWCNRPVSDKQKYARMLYIHNNCVYLKRFKLQTLSRDEESLHIRHSFEHMNNIFWLMLQSWTSFFLPLISLFRNECPVILYSLNTSTENSIVFHNFDESWCSNTVIYSTPPNTRHSLDLCMWDMMRFKLRLHVSHANTRMNILPFPKHSIHNTQPNNQTY